MAKSFKELLDLAKKNGAKKIAVAVAEDFDVLSAVKEAYDQNIVKPILIGNEEKIKDVAKKVKLNLDGIEIIDEVESIEACRKAVSIVSSQKADILMKGLVDTSIIMKQVLDKEIGLRTDKVISHVGVFCVPTYPKLFILTDAAMNIAPNLEYKKKILENAVEFAHSLDIKNPKVAVVCAKEKVYKKMESTIDAKELEDMNKRGEIKNCTVIGPLALDNAVSKEAAIHKGVDNPVSGDVDIFLMPNIEAGNIMYKTLTFLAKAQNAAVIVGAKSPIVLTSRTDTAETKLNSIVLSALMV